MPRPMRHSMPPSSRCPKASRPTRPSWASSARRPRPSISTKRAADRLVQLHAKAMQAQEEAHYRTANEWAKQTEAAFSQEQLGQLRTDFNAAIGNDGDAQEFK